MDLYIRKRKAAPMRGGESERAGKRQVEAEEARS